METKFIGEGGKCWGTIDDELPENIKEFINNNTEAVAREVESSAQSSSAFGDKTGKLRASITAKESKYPGGGWIVIAKSPHAWLVEYGHDMIDWHTGRKIGTVKKHPYLRPALNKGISSAWARFGIK